MFDKGISHRGFLLLILVTILFVTVREAGAQEGIISSVYISERTALQKMQSARKDGNEAEVSRLSNEIKEMVEQKKSWARDLLKLTESSIEKTQNENAPNLTDEQRLSLANKIDQLRAEIRILDFEREESTWMFFTEKHKWLEQIKGWEGEIQRIRDYAKETITQNEKKIIESEKFLGELIKAHAEELEVMNNYVREHTNTLNETKKRSAEGKANADEVKQAELTAQSYRENFEKIKQTMDEGTYTSRAGNWVSTNSIREQIKNSQDEIEKLNAGLADGSLASRFSGYYGAPAINACKDAIAGFQKEIDKLQELFTAEEFGNSKELRQRREYLYVEMLKLQEEAGLKDEKLAALTARKNELEKFIYHDFLTEIPKDDSGFIKAVKWISETINKVNEVTEKFERFKKIVDLVKGSSNPVNAINFIFKEATGTDLCERLAEKLLPERLLESPLVKRLIKGEQINQQDILKDAIVENLSPEARRKVEQTINLLNTARKGNIRDLIKERGFDQAMQVIDSQPELKKAWDAVNQAQKIIQNPNLLKDRLENSIRERVTLEFKSAGKELVDSMIKEETQKKLMAYQDKVKKIEEDMAKKYRPVEEAITETALNTVQKAIESRIGLNDSDKTAVEDLVENYSIPESK